MRSNSIKSETFVYRQFNGFVVLSQNARGEAAKFENGSVACKGGPRQGDSAAAQSSTT
jgi:hypothetical protein